MNNNFWLKKWEANDIGFHQEKPHSYLVRHYNSLGLTTGDTVFLPLCGKTLDLLWFRSQGIKVIGIELSENAVIQFFKENNLSPSVSALDHHKLYKEDHLSIYVGDFFDLDRKMLVDINAVYDRAALVALPSDLRQKYSRQLLDITSNAKQLLITFEYDQAQMEGPPFSVTKEEVLSLYGPGMKVHELECQEVEGGLKGRVSAKEIALLIKES